MDRDPVPTLIGMEVGGSYIFRNGFTGVAIERWAYQGVVAFIWDGMKMLVVETGERKIVSATTGERAGMDFEWDVIARIDGKEQL